MRLATLLGSLAIHLGLAALLLHVTRPAVFKPAPPLSTEIEVREIEPPRKPVALPIAPKPKVAAANRQRGASQAGGSPRGSHGKAAEAAARPAKGTGSPYAGDVPRALDLSLHTQLETASPGGETVHNRPGEIEPEGIRKSLAQARIEQWVEEDTASRRVEYGLIDDWFAKLHLTLGDALRNAPVPSSLPATVKPSFFRRYAAAAGAYGATGTPGTPSGPSDGRPPMGAEAGMGPLLGALGGANVMHAPMGGAPDLWAVVELKIDLGGKLRGSRVLESSGNRIFNLHVLDVLAVGLRDLPGAPDAGFGIHPEGTRSVWRVEAQLSYDHSQLSANDVWYLPVRTAVGALSGINVDEVAGHVTGQPRLDCRVELLQVY